MLKRFVDSLKDVDNSSTISERIDESIQEDSNSLKKTSQILSIMMIE